MLTKNGMAKQLRILDEAENIEAEHFAGAPRNQTESHCMILMLVIAEHVEVRNGCIRQGYCKQCSVLSTFKTGLMSMSYWPKLRGSPKFPGSLLESSKLCASCAQVVHKLCTRRTNALKLGKYFYALSHRLIVLLDLSQFGSRVKQRKKVLGPQSQLQP